MKRTATIDVDKDFTVEGEIVKAWTDRATGKRYIRGVASGVEEDRDGERVSERAIKKMVAAIAEGNVKLTASHQQDWFTEFAVVVKGEHDPETGQLVIDSELPPEGEDPVADKAWKEVQRRRLGHSIGGKLRKAFYEITDTGKRRKVLDDISLRHVMLTEHPSYAQAFAEAVAKTFDGDEPDETEFVEHEDEAIEDPVEKTDESEPEDDVEKGVAPSSGDEGNSGQDSKTGDRNAGTKSSRTPVKNTEDQDAESSDTGPKKRRLACPHCGHEFAADLPSNEDESSNDDGGQDDNDDRTGKSRQETTMPNVAKARELFEQAIGLLADDAETDAAETVGKDDAPETDVAKAVAEAVAKSEKARDERIDELETNLAEAFETIAKQNKQIVEFIGKLPLGRRSVARVLPRPEDGEVAKTEPRTAVEALKALNADTYGIE